MSRRALIVQSDAAVPPGMVIETARRSSIDIDVVRVDLDDSVLSDVTAYDALVVLGGNMSPNDEAGHPFLFRIIAAIRDAHAEQMPVLCICLGAQLAARAFGARAYPSPNGREFGWTVISRTDAGTVDPLFDGVDPDAEFVQWHGDTFDLPVNAVHLASTLHNPNQAFRLGSLVAVQFHPEVDADIIRQTLRADSDEARYLDEFLFDVERRTACAGRLVENFWKEAFADE